MGRRKSPHCPNPSTSVLIVRENTIFAPLESSLTSRQVSSPHPASSRLSLETSCRVSPGRSCPGCRPCAGPFDPPRRLSMASIRARTWWRFGSGTNASASPPTSHIVRPERRSLHDASVASTGSSHTLPRAVAPPGWFQKRSFPRRASCGPSQPNSHRATRCPRPCRRQFMEASCEPASDSKTTCRSKIPQMRLAVHSGPRCATLSLVANSSDSIRFV